MKKILLYVALFLTLLAFLPMSKSYAQQAPLMTHYYLNRFVFNPAVTATHTENQLHLMYRSQWAGLQGAPETMLLTYQYALPKKSMGLGATLRRENLNLVAQTTAMASYSYLVRIDSTQQLSFGLSLGGMYSSINWDKVMLEDLIDPALYGNADQFKADGNFGVLYTRNDLQIGWSIQNFFARGSSTKLDLNNAFLRYGNHSIFSASYKLREKSGNFTFEPILLYRFANNFPGQLDVSVVTEWRETAWVALGYRNSYGFSASIGANISDNIKASYAYEIANKNFSTASNGTHELMLSYRFDKRKRKPKFVGTDTGIDTLAPIKADSQVVVFRGIPEKYRVLGIGQTLILSSINFGNNETELPEGSIPELDELAQMLKYNTPIHVEIGVHVDSTVDKNLARTLTQKRAEAISKYLQKRGARKYQIAVTGYGNNKPLIKNDDEIKNNRVEIMMLKKKE